ncbi:MAG: DUF2281 domain-containing protein [Acidobacteriota bacterium]
MPDVTVEQLTERLQHLPPDLLDEVYVFVSRLSQRLEPGTESYQTMLASEVVLGREWDLPEEDAAWAHL